MKPEPPDPYRARDDERTLANDSQAVERGLRVEGLFLTAVLLLPVAAGLWALGRVGVAETVCLLGAILFLVDTCRSAWRQSRRF